MLRHVAGALHATLLAFLPIAGLAAEIHEDFPAQVHAGEKYVIYSHGLIVEGDNPRPVHPEFGTYDFPAIKAALFADGGFNLIAHHRPKNTDVNAYADRLASWVERLLAADVPPENITLVGFSRGAYLTALAAARFKDQGINTALMGVCRDGDIKGSPPAMLGGRVLSIYETTDVVGSCAKLAERSGLEDFAEVAISTGKKHGAFYLPRPEWMTPLKQWIAGGTPVQSAPAWPDTYVARLQALALIQTLNANLLSNDSATLTLDRWCETHRLASPAHVIAERVAGADKQPTAEQRELLQVTASEPVRYRRVRLRCGDHVLSEAENWYVPSRLTSEMNRILDTTDTSFGRVVRDLRFRRRTLSSRLLWEPLPESWAAGAELPAAASGPLEIPHELLQHRAVLVLPDGTPISALVETYTSAVLAFPQPRMQRAGR